ncbi:epidermal growth factor receptor kinase substrate 8-like protein 3b [Poecilia reticulata]|uniref:EPS8 signaling adaptor L3b n=1 Tax=Poecilia reticulata TaxID=8081 RepID=A0A3P9PK01_POERE|nr:PREDICTED: epidermal growth factor receptor kinase substrate 8-like protein 3 [Poecilia reticulata]XP_008411536.1 PREDICTED: epidermal growth factor receptor kinase substrate 8-like protein 3 [Poecilia reticulata]
MLGNGRPFSYSRGFSQEDFPQRRAFHQDEPKESLLQRNSMSRPSGKSIYMQRKEYAETLHKNPDSFQVRVEHLLICELDGQELKTEDDCVTKLKELDGKSRLWPQEMILEIKGAYVVLCDIETKVEMDSIPLRSIVKTRAVLESCTYNSLLVVTVQEGRRHGPQVFLFQCEETGAEIIKADLDKAVQRGGSDMEPRRMTPDISRQSATSFRRERFSPVQQEENLPPADYVAPQWDNRQPDYRPDSRSYTPQEEMSNYSDFQDSDMAIQRAEMERNTDIFNHILTDVEIFGDKVAEVMNAAPEKESKGKMMKLSKKKKSKSNAPSNLPHWNEYASFLQKIKYGFNLLGQLNGALSNPTADQYVHIFFSFLGNTVSLYPQDIPPSVTSPLLTEEAVRLLSQVLDPQEKQLWMNLGECWSIPRSSWPGNVSPYIPEFYDGWQPPAPLHSPPDPQQNNPLNRNTSQRFPPGPMNNDRNYSPRATIQRSEPRSNGPMRSLPSQYPTEPPLYMRVIYNFSARNMQELTVTQGEVVQVVQKSRPWWLVRNSRNEEGNVPPNILEQVENNESSEQQRWDSRSQVTLDYNSTSAEVKAWLESKNFSRITVSSLGVLTGKLLLGMTKEEIRTVCPEEAGKVFFQLQAVKSQLALSSEPSQMYNHRY